MVARIFCLNFYSRGGYYPPADKLKLTFFIQAKENHPSAVALQALG